MKIRELHEMRYIKSSDTASLESRINFFLDEFRKLNEAYLFDVEPKSVFVDNLGFYIQPLAVYKVRYKDD